MILVIGPYIGNFEQEVLTFRPWARWLFDRMGDLSEFNKVYIHTHFNRFFLYDFVPEKYLVPVYENLTRDELGQQDYIHNAIDNRDFALLIRNIKDEVSEREECPKKEIQIEHLNYVKYMPHMPIYKKLFSKIDVNNVENEYKDKIVFIPSNISGRKQLLAIKTFLNDYSDVVVIGDKKCRFKDENVVLNRYDYIENGFRLNVKIISEARCVITPLSVWTTICNLQQIPVFSWGEQPGQHKEGGIYYFNNHNCWALPETDLNTTLRMIEHFLKELI